MPSLTFDIDVDVSVVCSTCGRTVPAEYETDSSDPSKYRNASVDVSVRLTGNCQCHDALLDEIESLRQALNAATKP